MSFKENGAITRIFNTFKRLKTQIYQQDIDALKQLQSSLEYYKKENVNNNMLFSIILCMLVREKCKRYNNVNTALHIIGQDMKFSLHNHLQLLTMELNAIELSRFMEQSKIDVPTNEYDPVELQKYIDKWHGEYDKELLKKVLDSWTEEEVSDSFYNSANELLKDFEPILNKKQ